MIRSWNGLRRGERRGGPSGLDGEGPVLAEVLVDREDGGYTKFLHERKTGAVGEAEGFVGERLEDHPGAVQDMGCDAFDAQQAAGPDRLPELYSDGVAGPKADDRVAFVQHVVTGYQ